MLFLEYQYFYHLKLVTEGPQRRVRRSCFPAGGFPQLRLPLLPSSSLQARMCSTGIKSTDKLGLAQSKSWTRSSGGDHLQSTGISMDDDQNTSRGVKVMVTRKEQLTTCKFLTIFYGPVAHKPLVRIHRCDPPIKKPFSLQPAGPFAHPAHECAMFRTRHGVFASSPEGKHTTGCVVESSIRAE